MFDKEEETLLPLINLSAAYLMIFIKLCDENRKYFRQLKMVGA